MSIGTLMVLESAEARRRRDDRGRYMEDDSEMRMRGDDMRPRNRTMTMGRYSMEPDMRRSGGYSRKNPDMRMPGVYPSETRRDRRRSDMGEDAEMGGEGYFIWDGMDPHRPPMESNGPGYWRQGDREEGNITDMREYGRRYSPQSHMETGQQHHRQMTQQRQIGFQHHESENGDRLSREKAEEWVEGMKSPKWPRMADVKMLAQKAGITDEGAMAEFWAVLNATYSDVCKVAKKYNVDRSDFYADLAKALFLEDEDAMPGKPMLYYEYLVDKNED